MKVLWKRFKWVIILVGSAIAAAALLLLHGLIREDDPNKGSKVDPLPPVDEETEEAVRQAEEEALVARVEARVEAEEDKEELETVAKIEDGAERRRRLAEMMKRL